MSIPYAIQVSEPTLFHLRVRRDLNLCIEMVLAGGDPERCLYFYE